MFVVRFTFALQFSWILVVSFGADEDGFDRGLDLGRDVDPVAAKRGVRANPGMAVR